MGIVLQKRYIVKEREETLRNMKTQLEIRKLTVDGRILKMQTSMDNYHNRGQSLMNLELLESVRKKETKKLQAEEESQNQNCKVLLKNSEDQVSKLQCQI